MSAPKKTEAEWQAEMQTPEFWDEIWRCANVEGCVSLLVAVQREWDRRGSFGAEWLDGAMYQASQACERRIRQLEAAP